MGRWINAINCSHDELRWGRKKEVVGGKEIIVCGRCREELPAKLTKPKSPPKPSGAEESVER